MFPWIPILYLQAKGHMLTVCIDPGHPSEVGEGTRGKSVSEIHVAWVVAKRLQGELTKRGIRVVMTKTSERQFVRNMDRSKIANACHADLFLRLHCDSASGSGFTTYFPDRQGTVNGHRGPDQALLERIGPIAKRFQRTLATDLKGFLKDNGLKSDLDTAVGSRQGALTGSIYAKTPVVLVEMCVLTNPKDEAKVTTAEGQSRLARALADAAVRAIQP